MAFDLFYKLSIGREVGAAKIKYRHTKNNCGRAVDINRVTKNSLERILN